MQHWQTRTSWSRRFADMRVLWLVLFTAVASSAQPANQGGPLVDRVGSTGFIQLHADSFRALDSKQKELAYWLTQASIAIDPIIYDQLSAVRDPREETARRDGVASGGRRSGGSEEDHGFRQTLLGEPRQSQRDDIAEVSAGFQLRRVCRKPPGRHFTTARSAPATVTCLR